MTRLPFRTAHGRAAALLVLLPVVLAARAAPAQAGDHQTVPRVGMVADSTPPARVYPIDPDRAPRPSMRSVRTPRAPVIDGDLRDSVWALADSASDFVQQLPATGAQATYRTVVRVLYDDDHIYISALNYDPTPGRAITAGLQHDFTPSNSDVFAVALDTYEDRRNAFLFVVNPKGAVRDEQTFDDSRTIVEAWEGAIDVRTALVKTAEGDSAWTVEMAIPLRTLRFAGARGRQDWGVNFLRRVRRANETSYWAPVDRQYRVHRMSRAGTLTGLEGLRQGRNLQLKPYVVSSHAEYSVVPESGAIKIPDDMPFDRARA